MGTSRDNAAIASLVGKSKSNWELFDMLRREGKLDAAANRLYYSLFQAVKAYAVRTGKMNMDDQSDVHKTTMNLVSSEKGYATTYSCARRLRVLADYLPGHPLASDFVQDFLFKADSLRQHYIKEATA